MGGGGSSSSSSNSTSSVTEDNKVAAQDNAIALGNEAVFNYTDEFPPEVVQAFKDVLQFAKDTVTGAAGFAEKAISINEKAVQTVADSAQRSQELSQLKDSVLFQKFLPYAGVGALLLILVSGVKKGGKK